MHFLDDLVFISNFFPIHCSQKKLQNTIEGLKGITRIDLCIIDTEGKVLASTFPEADTYTGSVLAFIDSPADGQVIQGFQFFKVFD